MLRYFAPILRDVVFISEAALRLRLDIKRVQFGAFFQRRPGDPVQIGSKLFTARRVPLDLPFRLSCLARRVAGE